MDPVPDGAFGAGLPEGTLEHCIGVALAIGALAGAQVSGVGVAVQVRLAEVMAAAYGSGQEMRPGRPVPAPGGGWLHADLTGPEDADAYDLVIGTLGTAPSAAQIARAAQEWRLAVCDYRPARPPAPASSVFEVVPGTGGGRPFRVLDLTNMWAGPLATWLLQDLGAEVVKVEPSFRPDGFRARDGRGIHPGGRPCEPGRDSGMWNALNAGKQVVDLDLRRGGDRQRLVDLAAGSAIVVDTFSPRVMPNFGLADRPGGATRLAMPAFRADGPERDWVAYGTGVHAVAGLGDLGDGTFAAPAVAYPDPVGGFTAALAAVAAVAAGRVERAPAMISTSLEAAVAMLPDRPARDGSLGADPAGVGRRLLDRARSLGLMEDRPVCGRPLPHPRTVF
ncbi:MAG TPA: CoA transferase, partial [Acidimicrobiales bacterium]|nr:CoA transferase [Acidimicrobiales bacterium]